MVSLIHCNPVRSARSSAKLLEPAPKQSEEGWAVIERNGQEIDDGVLGRVFEKSNHFVNRRGMFRISDGNRLLELLVIPLRIDETELVLSLRQAFEKGRRGQRRARP